MKYKIKPWKSRKLYKRKRGGGGFSFKGGKMSPRAGFAPIDTISQRDLVVNKLAGLGIMAPRRATRAKIPSK